MIKFNPVIGRCRL